MLKRPENTSGAGKIRIYSRFSRSVALIVSVVMLVTGVAVWAGIDQHRRNAEKRIGAPAASATPSAQSTEGVSHITPEKEANATDAELLGAMGGKTKAALASEKDVPGLKEQAEKRPGLSEGQ
jgi:hypothetical protein